MILRRGRISRDHQTEKIVLIRHTRNLLSFLIFSQLPINFVAAQSDGSGSVFNVGLIIVAALIFLVAVYIVTENLLGLEAKKYGIGDLSSKGIGRKTPKYVDGSFTALRKGHNIKLEGSAKPIMGEAEVSTYAIQPGNFVGISPIPKVIVEEGQEVLAGESIFFDKKRPEIMYAAPVSGEVVAINRGEKRSIKEVVILADKSQKHLELPEIDLNSVTRDSLIEFLLRSGAWPLIKQRPYDIVADPKVVPENIFISTFDTAPLAPNLNFVIEGQKKAFDAGIEILQKLTKGKVVLGLDANGKEAPHAIYRENPTVEKHYFSGRHPSGNVGVQIHHIAPISNGKEVWVLGVQDVVILGKLITERRLNTTRVIALTGQSLKDPQYVRAQIGAKIADLIKGQQLADQEQRYISGDVLSGRRKLQEEFLNFYDDQLTVIPEGREFELFGWLSPFKMQPSISRALPSFLFPNMEFKVNTNTNGEERAFVMTGQYESVLPMDIYPQHLMKAILTKDFEKMEGLGIYELSEEDIALCEFACTSKQPLQHILRSGLDLMREQG